MAVDDNGRARYSQLWNKGKLDFALRADDKHIWLTVVRSAAFTRGELRRLARRHSRSALSVGGYY
jgi:hypothetical protein